MPRRFLLAALLLLLAACASAPPRPELASVSALPEGEGTKLDERVQAQTAAHPGQSGFRLVFDGVEAFALRAGSARAAGRSLDVQYYIWHNDTTGRLLLSELAQAADRGVRVRLLLDDMDARCEQFRPRRARRAPAHRGAPVQSLRLARRHRGQTGGNHHRPEAP
jgi:putative cardiolipin synthase